MITNDYCARNNIIHFRRRIKYRSIHRMWLFGIMSVDAVRANVWTISDRSIAQMCDLKSSTHTHNINLRGGRYRHIYFIFDCMYEHITHIVHTYILSYHICQTHSHRRWIISIGMKGYRHVSSENVFRTFQFFFFICEWLNKTYVCLIRRFQPHIYFDFQYREIPETHKKRPW